MSPTPGSWPAWLAEQTPRRDAIGTLARDLAGTPALEAATPGVLLDILTAAGDLEHLPALALAAREYAAGDGGVVADGYLHRGRGGWHLVVHCPSCSAWHWHGARDGDLVAGAITPRVSHCSDRDAYRAVRVSMHTWAPSWATARGNRSASYRRFLDTSRASS